MKAVLEALNRAPESAAWRPRQSAAAAELKAAGLDVYPSSIWPAGSCVLGWVRQGRQRRLLVVGRAQALAAWPEVEQRFSLGEVEAALVRPGAAAADAARELLEWMNPRTLGLVTSAGMGDRTGLATPGHLLAATGTGLAPVVAQQSIREMTRTQRTAREVMNDACWGVLQSGWTAPFGSDADHLKTVADLETCAAAGFTMFTIDPGEHVCGQADAMDARQLEPVIAAYDLSKLETCERDLRAAYLGREFTLDGAEPIRFDEATLARAVIKYGGAVAHTAAMYRHLCSVRGEGGFELEVSVDETPTPTTPAEHYLVAAELKRLGVRWVSLAPRFVGDFEKGIDYKGDLGAFRADFARHAAVARTLGPYKLSLHSGSDKFSIYAIAAELSGGLVHLKTAGTSYLEALRVAARKQPALFRRILGFARERFEADKASYQISADLARVPAPNLLPDEALEPLLDDVHGRQVLHVTFGSVLSGRGSDGAWLFRDALLGCLLDHEDEHYAVLASHLGRHLRPFVR